MAVLTKKTFHPLLGILISHVTITQVNIQFYFNMAYLKFKFFKLENKKYEIRNSFEIFKSFVI